MVGVVEGGTASCCLDLAGDIQAAAKTGTAELGLENDPDLVHAWMIAFAPADDPQYAISVVLTNIRSTDELAATGRRLAGPIVQGVLDYLLTSEDILLYSDSYASTLGALSSLDWKPATYEKKILEELNRIDQTIAVLNDKASKDSFNHHAHMSRVRKTALYPEDTFSGRQAYLDRLSQEMINAQADWFDTYTNYNPSELSILGEEATRLPHQPDGSSLRLLAPQRPDEEGLIGLHCGMITHAAQPGR